MRSLVATITLAGSDEAHFLDCWSGVPGITTPIIDLGGSGQALALRNYNGGIRLQNKSGPEAVSVDLNSGQVILDATVTAGQIVIRGVGELTDNSGPGVDLHVDGLINNSRVAATVWADAAAIQIAADLSFVKDIEGGRWKIENDQMIFYQADNVTEVARFDLFDGAGLPTETDVAERTRI